MFSPHGQVGLASPNTAEQCRARGLWEQGGPVVRAVQQGCFRREGTPGGRVASDQHSVRGQRQPVPHTQGESQNSPLGLLGSDKGGMKPVPAGTAWGMTLSVSLSPMPLAQEGPGRVSGTWTWWAMGKHHSPCAKGPLLPYLELS